MGFSGSCWVVLPSSNKKKQGTTDNTRRYASRSSSSTFLHHRFCVSLPLFLYYTLLGIISSSPYAPSIIPSSNDTLIFNFFFLRCCCGSISRPPTTLHRWKDDTDPAVYSETIVECSWDQDEKVWVRESGWINQRQMISTLRERCCRPDMGRPRLHSQQRHRCCRPRPVSPHQPFRDT
ncbi:hypothetical protein BRARA_B02000 [Brassica rapa]|uniref:Uncharacterized protein n=1 Tax=Brassica campestris TaxID=3711 RepID=A0A398ABQ8_BRACM|nr:hypothetical protein BRARA_B02000 [Brassica rapa]